MLLKSTFLTWADPDSNGSRSGTDMEGEITGSACPADAVVQHTLVPLCDGAPCGRRRLLLFSTLQQRLRIFH